jgi:oleandomycin transport system ATP-binding protein
VSAPVENGRLLPEIVRELDAANIELAEFALRKAGLDEVFLALTGQPSDASDASDPSDASDASDPSPAPELPELNGSAR